MADDLTPEVSVVIPVKDDAEGLARCLQALAGQDYPGPVEVLVVDNGSAHPPQDVVDRFAFARLLLEPTPGSYRARNLALTQTRGRIVAFTDADCRPEPTWLSAGVARVEQAGVGLVAGAIRVELPAGRGPRTVELYELLHGFPQEGYVQRFHFGATANVFTRREVIDVVGPFEETLASGGDKQWGGRVHAAGFAVVYEPSSVVVHPPRSTWRQYRTKLHRVFLGELDARARRGESAGDVGRLGWATLKPPVSASVKGLTDARLRPAWRGKYIAAVWVARYTAAVVGWQERRRHPGPASAAPSAATTTGGPALGGTVETSPGTVR